MRRLRQYPAVLVWACGIIIVGALIARELMMGLAFNLKLYRSAQSKCVLKSVLVRLEEDIYPIPIAKLEEGSREAMLAVEALPLIRKRVFVEVEFDNCEPVQSQEFVANRGDAFYVRIGDRKVEVTLRSAGAWF